MDKLTLQDLKEVAGRDKWWFVVMSPFAFGLFALLMYLGLSYLFGARDYFDALVSAALSVVLVFSIQELLGWRAFSKRRWAYLYEVHLQGETYHIVKDGARRARVIQADKQRGTIDQNGSNSVLVDLRTGKEYHSPELAQWLKTELPTLGTIDGDNTASTEF